VADPATDGPTLLVHRGVTGHPYYAEDGAEPVGVPPACGGKHERLVVSLDKGELRFADLRKLRGVWLADGEDDIVDVMGSARSRCVGY
jgi:formamidopyrimidine-DNA glycosylase